MNIEDQAFVDHATRPGSVHELIERKDALYQTLVDRTFGTRHRATLAAVRELSEKINPAPDTPPEQDATSVARITDMAQGYRNRGDDPEAGRIMQRIGLDASDLQPRPHNEVMDEAEAVAAGQYKIERSQVIAGLRLSRGLDTREATSEFNKTHAHDMKARINRQHGLVKDHPL